MLVTLPLLILQATAGGVVTLAEAGEPVTATSHVEAQHEPGCPVLHDALRCVLCHYADSRLAVQQTLAPLFSGPERRTPPRADAVPAFTAGVRLHAYPRAPPLALS